MSVGQDTGLHATEIGDSGERVLFLHGLFGQGRNFTQIAKALRPTYRSLLLDLPDHGRSAWTEGFSYLVYADLVAAHLDAHLAASDRGGPVHVVGHSLGGKVAMVLALRRPDLVDRLVVVDIAPTDGVGVGEFEHLLASLADVDLTTLGTRRDADERLRGPIPDDRVRGFLLQNLRAGPAGFEWTPNLRLLRRDLDTIGGFPTVPASFDHPVLWLAGELSDYVRPASAPTMRRLFPRTIQVTIRGAGHWVHSEQPEAFVSALRVFLAADRQPGAVRS